jgi:hypothetical protein
MNIIEELEGLISSKTQSMKLVFSLIKLETSLARLSILPLIFNIIMVLVILMTTWFATMMLWGYLFFMLSSSLILGVVSIVLLNLILLYFLYQLMKYNLNNMSFAKTREYFSKKGSNEENEPKKITERADRVSKQTIKK